MPFVDWNDDFSFGQPDIDEQHRRLLALINELYDAVEAGRGKLVVEKTLEDLLQYITTHFKYEEGLLLQARSPNYKEHKEEHDLLTRQVLDILSHYHNEQRKSDVLSAEVLELLKVWLFHHILESHRKIVTSICA
jgi:hemerythrin-like metal-binding protein